MNRINQWVRGLTVVAMLLAASPALAQKQAEAKPAKPAAEASAKASEKGAKAAEKKAKAPALKGHHLAMAGQAELDDKQKEQLLKVVLERDAALASNAAGQKQAKESDDKEKLGKLRAERKQIEAKYEALMLGIMTPEQALKWRGYQLFFRQSIKNSKANATDEQKAQARTIADEVAEAHKLDGDSDRKTIDKAYAAYLARVSEEVLTPEQREALVKKPTASKPDAEAKAKVAETTKNASGKAD